MLRLAAVFASLAAVVCFLAVVSQGGGDGKSTAADALLEAQRGQAMLDSANRLDSGRKTWLNEEGGAGESFLGEEQTIMQGQSLVAGERSLATSAQPTYSLIPQPPYPRTPYSPNPQPPYPRTPKPPYPQTLKPPPPNQVRTG